MTATCRPLVTIALLCHAALACSAGVGSAPSASAAPAEPMARLPLRPIGEHGLMLVDVEVGGSSRPFLVDTGGGLTVLAPELAPAAGCAPAGRLTGFRHDGGRLDLPRCAPAHLSIGGRARSLEAALLDLEALGLEGVGGLVALATFEGEAFTLDLAGRELIVESDASLALRTAGMRELKVRPGRQAGGAALDLFVAVRSPRGELWLELDSGNAGPLRLAPHAVEQLGIELAAASPAAPASIELDFAGLGPTKVEAIRSEQIYDGLVNSRFFLEHVVSFDLRSAAPRAWAGVRSAGARPPDRSRARYTPSIAPAVDAPRRHQEAVMSKSPAEPERRSGEERRGEERRKQSIPVAVERRSGHDRRKEGDRRGAPKPVDS